MYVRMYGYTHTYIHAYMHILICLYKYRTSPSFSRRIHTYVHRLIHTHIHTHTYIHLLICLYISTGPAQAFRVVRVSICTFSPVKQVKRVPLSRTCPSFSRRARAARFRVTAQRYSLYLLYWYNSTNTDALLLKDVPGRGLEGGKRGGGAQALLDLLVQKYKY